MLNTQLSGTGDVLVLLIGHPVYIIMEEEGAKERERTEGGKETEDVRVCAYTRLRFSPSFGVFFSGRE